METQINTVSGLFDKGKLFLKSVFIFIMALGLFIPTQFTRELIRERKGRQTEAIEDIGGKWGRSQTLTGPFLMIPYLENTKDDRGQPLIVKRTAYFMPDKLNVVSDIEPEVRKRGIYEVVVYRSKIRVNGNFQQIRWQELGVPSENIQWSGARMLFHTSDILRGVNEDLVLDWNGSKIPFGPQAQVGDLKDALAAPVAVSPDSAINPLSFDMNFTLNGSGSLLVAAGARENSIEMRSRWADPKFSGMKLPDERTVSDTGFEAKWKYMNRTVPLVWKDKFNDLSSTALGTELIVTVDGYDKTERSVKYALLCIVLTFAAFFLIETIYKKPLHLVQYALAGLALVLFYTLLLSVSEYLGFNLAYGIAALSTIGLVTWFVGGIMKSGRLGLFIAMVLGVVYSYIFTIIQMQDYALLMGSVGLFLALAVIMYFSRKIQW